MLFIRITILQVLFFFVLVQKAFAMPEMPNIPEFPEIPVYDRVLHLNNLTGSDSNDGLSETSAFFSLRYAVSEIEPGDKLIIHGTDTPYYSDWASLARIDKDTRWVTVEGKDGENGERATIMGRLTLGGNQIVNGQTKTSKTHRVFIKNLLFQGEGGASFNVTINPNSHDIAFLDVEFDCQKSINNDRALWTQNRVYNLSFKNVYVHHCGYSEQRNVPYDANYDGVIDSQDTRLYPTDCGGICVKGREIDNVLFENVVATHNVGDGIGGASFISFGNSYFKNCVSAHNTGDGFDIGGTQVVIYDSISHNNGSHQGMGFKLWSKHSWIVNSLAFDNYQPGVSIKPKHSGASTGYILESTFARNNTVGRYGGELNTSSIHPPSLSDSLDLYIHNNVFYTVNTSSIVINNYNNQTIKGESNNTYFSHYDPNLPSHWTYKDAIHVRDGKMNVEAQYSFAEVRDGGRWSLENSHLGLGIGNVSNSYSSISTNSN